MVFWTTGLLVAHVVYRLKGKSVLVTCSTRNSRFNALCASAAISNFGRSKEDGASNGKNCRWFIKEFVPFNGFKKRTEGNHHGCSEHKAHFCRFADRIRKVTTDWCNSNFIGQGMSKNERFVFNTVNIIIKNKQLVYPGVCVYVVAWVILMDGPFILEIINDFQSVLRMQILLVVYNVLIQTLTCSTLCKWSVLSHFCLLLLHWILSC